MGEKSSWMRVVFTAGIDWRPIVALALLFLALLAK
jgi:hypothetical protein